MKKQTSFVLIAILVLCMALTFVACDKTVTYTVEFDANGGTGTLDAVTVNEGEAVNLPTNTFVKQNCTFAGWATSADGEVVYADGATVSPTADLKLYAVWSQNQHTISFNANGGTGTLATVTVNEGAETNLPSNTFVNPNHTFAGWATSADGEVVYADGAAVTLSADLNLYAVWNRVQYTISFDANGGTGTMASMTVDAGSEVALTANAFANPTYTFAGWAKDDTNTVAYEDGQTVTASSNLTLKALWTKNPITADVTAAQKQDEQKVVVGWANPSETIVKIEITVKHGDDVVDQTTLDKAEDIANGNIEYDVFYGKWDVEVTICGAVEDCKATYNLTANVSADEYGIAFFNGTFPVSIFTLHMMDADNTAIASTLDTYIWLSRPNAYDWDNLPEHMHEMPVAKAGTLWNDAFAKVKAWVAELYEINNDSHFTIYCTDNYSRIAADFTIANGIPTDKWNAVMFADGTWTANELNNLFGNTNAQDTYNTMAAAWNQFVAGEIKMTELPRYSASLSKYIAIIANEMDNVKWYTGRLRVGENLTDNEFISNLLSGLKSDGKLKENYLNSLLAALTAEEKATFKSLYHIDENTFAEATDSNKKVMMILGTSWSGEGEDLEDYMRITMQTYGTDYVYYYKGHPGYPTSSYPVRQTIIDTLKGEGYELYELDNSVAAEFFLFFFEDIEMIGYSSTTFESATDANAAGAYNKTADSAYCEGLLETYISKVTDISAFNTKYANNGIALKEGGSYYLVEFTDEMATDKDIAIYDVATKTLTTYSLISVTATATQNEENEQIKVAWTDASETISKIELKAYHGNTLVESKTLTTAADIAAGNANLDVFWGAYSVNAVFYGASDNAIAEYNLTVGVSSDNYNIAFFNATFPVSIFTLHKMDLDSVALTSKTSADNTYVWLSRKGAYDWDNLPDNMSEIPVADHNVAWNAALANTKAWVAELYALNNDAHFNVYCTDNYSRIIVELLISNGIPSANWNAGMFTDGTWTANNINDLFGNENAQALYTEMSTAWNQFVAGEIGMTQLPYYRASLSVYAPIIAKEMNNVKWFTGRLRIGENLTDNTFITSFLSELKNNETIKENYLNSLLAALSEEEKATFKSLYHIDENTFAEATNSNKKVMMILGTSWSGEGEDLEDYMRITMQTYGTDYVYYYKGHPGYPTSSYPVRQTIIDTLKGEGYELYELDNSVAAEFFLFFFEDIEMIGYSSTTFESATDANAAGAYNKTADSAYCEGLLETYISKITDVSAFNSANTDKGLTLTEGGSYYLVEFKDEMATDKDIAIYDKATKTTKFYKLVDGTYSQVA